MAATATTSSLLARRLLLTRRFLSSPLRPFSTTATGSSFSYSSSSSSSSDDSHAGSDAGPDPEQQGPADQDHQAPVRPRARDTRPLENGLDPGIYKAIMVGKVGQEPIQKRLRSGRTVVLFSLGTGGIRNNRRPLDGEEPHQYAERCSVQWHRVCIYPDRLGSLALKHVKTGSVLYLEGNLETKVFSDPITGLVRRIREIAVRSNGRLLFLGNDGNAPKLGEAKGVGYF
ncbi:single-stranded DNA-binding protein, mitochondrial [Oryza brachyantha]|uniref:Single-stranded DNA-binding protein n=1 Tax=Oryza brachyantha TaxID=4533 RepID=J3L2A2_ORYBR|nr:single-stranded DNA-binding protein, mitochondrial [Oryza brachyantha]